MQNLIRVLTSGIALAAISPARVGQQQNGVHLQGRFTEARGFTLVQVNLRGSLFSNWLFDPTGAGGDAATAKEVNLSENKQSCSEY